MPMLGAAQTVLPERARGKTGPVNHFVSNLKPTSYEAGFGFLS